MKRPVISGRAALAFADDAAGRDKRAGAWESPDAARRALESRADAIHVVKRRFRAHGDELHIETMPIVPEGKDETAKLCRMVVAQT